MNIGIVLGTFLPNVNGVISYVLDTATELTKRGHTVTVFAPAPRRGVKIDTSIYPEAHGELTPRQLVKFEDESIYRKR